MTAADPAPPSDDAPLYVASVRNTGGTAGRVDIDDGPAGLPSLPTGAPRPGGDGFDPEQFLAMAWSTCFGETLRVVLRERRAAHEAQERVERGKGEEAHAAAPPEPEVTATVALHRDPAGGYRFVPRLTVRIDGIPEAEAREALAAAHARCPVSRLLRATDEPEVVLAADPGPAPAPPG